jgi:hypothetical protein
MTRRSSFAQQIMYDNYITPEWIRTHPHVVTEQPRLGVDEPRWFGNSPVAAGLGEYYARQLINADGNHNHFPLYSSSTDYYTSPGTAKGPIWMGGSPAAAGDADSFVEQNAQVRSNSDPTAVARAGVFLQESMKVRPPCRSCRTRRHISTTHFWSSPTPNYAR